MKQLFFTTIILAGLFGFLHPLAAQDIPSHPDRTTDSSKVKVESDTKKHQKHRKFIQAADTLSKSDYMMSINRVNDNLNDIRDSIKLGFETLKMSHDITQLAIDFGRIRQDFKDRRSSLNIRNLYLYQSFANDMDLENDQIITHLNLMYKRVYRAKLKVKKALNDSIFKKLYADSLLRNNFDTQLSKLERKWVRTDSMAKANVDSLNQLKLRAVETSINLTNMINGIDHRLDRADQHIFGREMNYIWQADTLSTDTTKKTNSVFKSEQKAFSYYSSQSSELYVYLGLFALLTSVWLFRKRKILRTIKQHEHEYSFLHLHYLNRQPLLALAAVIISIMFCFEAYAPTSYIAIQYGLLLFLVSPLLLPAFGSGLRIGWGMLTALFLSSVFTYLFAESTLIVRLWMIILHITTAVVCVRMTQNAHKFPYPAAIKTASVVGVGLSLLAVVTNVFGRVFLSSIFGLTALFEITQAIVLMLVVDVILEVVLLQLVASRTNKQLNGIFDTDQVRRKLKIPLFIIAIALWLIMLTSNLNLYHFFCETLVEILTKNRVIGNISFQLTGVCLFVFIIWLAHILQRLIGFLFGDTGMENEDISSAGKAQHSRLLITRLLVLIGGYLLAIVISGLPIDKLTFLLGALGVGIGMGLQNVVNNFVSGIILIFDGSLKIGDEIEVNGQAGKVKEVGLRASTLNTADGAEVIIPNGNILSQNIVNWTFSNDRKRVDIDITLLGKELDANVINEIINKTLGETPQVIASYKPVILYTKVSSDSCSITIRFWSTIGNADISKSNLMLNLKTSFGTAHIGFE